LKPWPERPPAIRRARGDGTSRRKRPPKPSPPVSPRGDFFLIYNHNLRELDDRRLRDSNELLTKVQYTFRP
jgi:hypothetical protein